MSADIEIVMSYLNGGARLSEAIAAVERIKAAEEENQRLRRHVRYLLDYIGVDMDGDLEALGAPSGIVAARRALVEAVPE